MIDYKELFSNTTFDFIESNEDFAIYTENIEFVEETVDYVVFRLDFSYYGEVTSENLTDWQRIFPELNDIDGILTILLSTSDRLNYNAKQSLKFYLDKEILDDAVENDRGEIPLSDIVSMIVTISFEENLTNEFGPVEKDVVEAFSESIGFPIPEDIDKLSDCTIEFF